MRTSKAEQIIKANPEMRLLWAVMNKKTDHIIETRSGKIWREHIVKNGVDSYTVYNLNDRVIKKGVAK